MAKLYRYFNAKNELLYVGISINPVYRLSQHKNTAPWFDLIDRIEIETYDNTQQAREIEKVAIQQESPLYNVADQGRKHTARDDPCSPSMRCKSAGLAGLAELSRISDVSVQTLINWSKSKPTLFDLVINGASKTKIIT